MRDRPAGCYFEFMPLIKPPGARGFAGQRVQRTRLEGPPQLLNTVPNGAVRLLLCDEAAINKRNSDAACYRMTNRKVLAMLRPRVNGAAQENR